MEYQYSSYFGLHIITYAKKMDEKARIKEHYEKKETDK
jgi:hypothetical protein